jgi:hypothetical protein
MKPIPGFEDYLADDIQGNIYSMLPHGGDGGNSTKPPTVPRLLKATKDSSGYWQVSLRKNGKRFSRRVARLVLETFVSPPPANTQACHNDGTRTNDKLWNLRWDTQTNNQRDRIQHGTTARGENSVRSKLTELQVRVIRRCIEFGMYERIVAQIFKVARPTINSIASRRRWRHI